MQSNLLDLNEQPVRLLRMLEVHGVMMAHNFFYTRFWDLTPSLTSIYYYIWLHVLLPLSPFPASAIFVGSACSKAASVAGFLSWETLVTKFIATICTILFFKDESHMIHRAQLYTVYIYIYVCSLYDIIWYTFTCVYIYAYGYDIIPAYHLTTRPSYSLW